MTSRILIRTSSILLVMNGFLSSLINWLTLSIYRFGYVNPLAFSPYLPLLLAAAILTPIALVGLIIQFWRERHWLGWLGILLTFVGYLSAIGYLLLRLPQFVEIDGFFSLERAFSLLASLGISCGLLFWALDLPPSSRFLLLQKAAMGALSLFPFIQQTLLPQFDAFYQYDLSGMPNRYLILTILGGGLWMLFGISVWHIQQDTSIPLSRTSPEDDTNFQLMMTPIPPRER